jgi:hypothetical protein
MSSLKRFVAPQRRENPKKSMRLNLEKALSGDQTKEKKVLL